MQNRGSGICVCTIPTRRWHVIHPCNRSYHRCLHLYQYMLISISISIFMTIDHDICVCLQGGGMSYILVMDCNIAIELYRHCQYLYHDISISISIPIFVCVTMIHVFEQYLQGSELCQISFSRISVKESL